MAIMVQHAATIDRGEKKRPEFNEYPRYMTHPAFAPATVGELVTHPSGKFTYHVGGTSVRFPPMLVLSEEQRDYYASKGYVDQGKSDGAAFARLVNSAPVDPSHAPQEYPKWVGNSLVQNAEEEAALTGGAAVAQPSQPSPQAITAVKTPDQLRIEQLEAANAEMRRTMEAFLAAQKPAEAAPAPAALAPARKATKKGGKRTAKKATRKAPAASAQAGPTKGQKAWATRQARAAERAAAQERPEPSPAADTQDAG